MSLPEEFTWLRDIKDNCILTKALEYYDLIEFPGEENNPLIISMAKETGKRWYTSDRFEWCGVFISYIVHSCGFPIPQRSNRSLSWIDWGVEVTDPQPGDIIIFKKEGISGHIGIFVKEEEDHYWVLGGNQNLEGKDSVNIKKLKKRKFVRICRPEQNETSQDQITPESTEGEPNQG